MPARRFRPPQIGLPGKAVVCSGGCPLGVRPCLYPQEHEELLAAWLLPVLRGLCSCLPAGSGDEPSSQACSCHRPRPRPPRPCQEPSPRSPRAPPRRGQQLIRSKEGLRSFIPLEQHAGPPGSLASSWCSLWNVLDERRPASLWLLVNNCTVGREASECLPVSTCPPGAWQPAEHHPFWRRTPQPGERRALTQNVSALPGCGPQAALRGPQRFQWEALPVSERPPCAQGGVSSRVVLRAHQPRRRCGLLGVPRTCYPRKPVKKVLRGRLGD